MATTAQNERLAEQEQARAETLAEDRASGTYRQRLASQIRERVKQKVKQEIEKRVKKKVKRKVEKAAAKTFIQWFIANQFWLIYVELGLVVAFLLFLTIFSICTSKDALLQAGLWVAGFNDFCSVFQQ